MCVSVSSLPAYTARHRYGANASCGVCWCHINVGWSCWSFSCNVSGCNNTYLWWQRRYHTSCQATFWKSWVVSTGILILFYIIVRLHRMHEMQTIITDDRGVCQSVCHAAQLSSDACSVHGVIRCSLCQITLASCFLFYQNMLSDIEFSCYMKVSKVWVKLFLPPKRAAIAVATWLCLSRWCIVHKWLSPYSCKNLDQIVDQPF